MANLCSHLNNVQAIKHTYDSGQQTIDNIIHLTRGTVPRGTVDPIPNGLSL